VLLADGWDVPLERLAALVPSLCVPDAA
jgi:hypothetical protein